MNKYIKDFIRTLLALIIFGFIGILSLAKAMIAFSWAKDINMTLWLILGLIDIYVAYLHFRKER